MCLMVVVCCCVLDCLCVLSLPCMCFAVGGCLLCLLFCACLCLFLCVSSLFAFGCLVVAFGAWRCLLRVCVPCACNHVCCLSYGVVVLLVGVS